MVGNMEFGNIKEDAGVERGNFSSMESVKRTLDKLKDNANQLASLGNLPLYKKEVDDVSLAIANLEARIGEQEN